MFVIVKRDRSGNSDLRGHTFKGHLGHRVDDRDPKKKPESLCHGRDDLSCLQVVSSTGKVFEILLTSLSFGTTVDLSPFLGNNDPSYLSFFCEIGTPYSFFQT